MGLSTALFSSVSGLDATGTAISVIGDNIANSNTPGFKGRRAEFSDVLGRSIGNAAGFSQLGAGTTLSRISPVFSQGTFETTGRTTDLAIEGNGFFVLESDQGRFYSRAGIFTFDNTSYLVNPQGMRVQGFSIDPITGLSTGQLGDIQLSTALSAPRPSQNAALGINLDANAPVLGGFDPANPFGTSNFNSVMTMYDSLGNGHPVTFYYTKTGTNAWSWTAALPPGDTTTPPATPTDPAVVQGSGTLTFDAAGTLQAFSGSPLTLQFSGGAAPAQSVAVSFGPVGGVGSGDPTTQFGSTSATMAFTQDGFAAGQLQAIVIDREGFITGQFSNGETSLLGQVALASFPNIEGLVSVGNTNLIESRTSGQALVGAPETGSLGSIRSSSLEQSNVDLATEFVRLIINQRAFQANTRIVSTTNELLANLVNLGQ